MFCYTPEHIHYITYLVLPSMIFLQLIFPLLLFFGLYKNRHNLHTVNT